ncbi:MAG: LexA family transcriptional regulator [Nitrospina sp.]|jgi:SOS-response transcriptional repressor LexA|nr:LexA family transcriptional regulator [Nitrospina sp.]MBT6601206.1 LexA family transcriptional regulator [Nitrospina sp.]
MTIKDSDYLSRLQNYYATHHSFPSYARLCNILGLAAKSAVNKVLFRLAKQRYLIRTPDEVWIPTERFFERNISHTPVVAGLPTTVSDVTTDPFMIDQFLISKPSKTILVPVQGDSMINVGINDGDVVVVEIRSTAKTGDIVVANIDDEFTVKTLGKKRGKPVLLPANDLYPVIRPKGSLEILGVVIGLIRKYEK